MTLMITGHYGMDTAEYWGRVLKTRLLPAFVMAFCFIPPCLVYCEADTLHERNSDNIEKADRLGEDFQNQGPWSRQRSPDDNFYAIPQPREYQATPGSQIPEVEPKYDITQYPLCYNPYAGAYEYCYRGGSSFYRSGFRSPSFGLKWRRGRSCPPGYYFVPEKGCYRN